MKVKIYVTNYCPFCRRAESLLKQKGISFEAVDVTNDDQTREWLVKETGYKTIPQIFIDGKPIGGYDQLLKLDQEGGLAHLSEA